MHQLIPLAPAVGQPLEQYERFPWPHVIDPVPPPHGYRLRYSAGWKRTPVADSGANSVLTSSTGPTIARYIVSQRRFEGISSCQDSQTTIYHLDRAHGGLIVYMVHLGV